MMETELKSGAFGKLLVVSRETTKSCQASLRSNGASYRSASASLAASTFTGGRDGTTETPGGAPPQEAGWIGMAFVMLSEVVGAGVLTLSQKYAELGYILASGCVYIYSIVSVPPLPMGLGLVSAGAILRSRLQRLN